MTMPNVLIIDDDPLLRDFLAKILQSFGITEVRQTGSITMAKEVLNSGTTHLAFVDIELDGENGLKSLPGLQEASPKTKFVIVSAHSSVDNAMEALSEGAKSFVVKPFTAKKIKGVLSKLDYLT